MEISSGSRDSLIVYLLHRGTFPNRFSGLRVREGEAGLQHKHKANISRGRVCRRRVLCCREQRCRAQFHLQLKTLLPPATKENN